jgi:hypothetical protein
MSEYAFVGDKPERLAGIEATWDPGTTFRLQALGVGPGWRCLEAGAGAGSIAAWLANRVGPTGRVIATDVETTLLAPLRVTTSKCSTTICWPTSFPLAPSTSSTPDCCLSGLARVTRCSGSWRRSPGRLAARSNRASSSASCDRSSPGQTGRAASCPARSPASPPQPQRPCDRARTRSAPPHSTHAPDLEAWPTTPPAHRFPSQTGS